MKFSLIPDLIFESVCDLTPEALLSDGIRFLMMDFDNTIVPYTTDVPTPEVDAWLRRILSSKVTICMVSNTKKGRVQEFCKVYGIPCIMHARKPFARFGIREALQTFRIPESEAALIGDQIYTDVLGGNCAGVTTILIRAIHQHNLLLKLRHVAELPFIAIGKLRLKQKSCR